MVFVSPTGTRPGEPISCGYEVLPDIDVSKLRQVQARYSTSGVEALLTYVEGPKDRIIVPWTSGHWLPREWWAFLDRLRTVPRGTELIAEGWVAELHPVPF